MGIRLKRWTSHSVYRQYTIFFNNRYIDTILTANQEKERMLLVQFWKTFNSMAFQKIDETLIYIFYNDMRHQPGKAPWLQQSRVNIQRVISYTLNFVHVNYLVLLQSIMVLESIQCIPFIIQLLTPLQTPSSYTVVFA